MYRPTVRMDNCYKEWIEEVVKETGLDRNQVIRLALFSAPFSNTFKEQINSRKDFDVNLPSPTWREDSDGGPWRRSEWKKEKRGDDVSARIEQKRTESIIKSDGIVEPRETKRQSDVTGNTTRNERRERKVHQSETSKPKINIPAPNRNTGRGIKINIG